MDLEALDDRLSQVRSYGDLAPVLATIADTAGMQHYAVARFRGGDNRHLVQTIHNSPASHADACDNPDYWRASELVQRLFATPSPIVYEGNVTWAPPADIPGFEHGVAVCSHEHRGATLLFLARATPAVSASEHMDLVTVAMLAATRVQHCMARLHLQACPLSERQLDCLRHTLAGHTAPETARALGLSARTVEQYLTRARDHLQTPNSLATAVHAIDHGWITPAQVYALMAA